MPVGVFPKQEIVRRRELKVEYSNFIEDFPKRCEKLYSSAGNTTAAHNLNVTNILCHLACALVIPYERIGNRDSVTEDWKRFPKAESTYQNLMGMRFVGSDLCKDVAQKTKWQYQCGLSAQEVNEKTWVNSAPQVTDGLVCREIVDIIRNALSHGAIFTEGQRKESEKLSEIMAVGFACWVRQPTKTERFPPFRVLVVGIQALEQFFRDWVSFLQKLPLAAESKHGLSLFGGAPSTT